TIDHDNFAVIAKVDLEAIEPAAACGKGFDLYAGLAHWLNVAVRQGVAADTVVEHVNGYAFGSFLHQQGLQAATEVVVVDDKKLDQYSLAGVTDGIENRRKSGFAIDQQAHLVIGKAGHVSQFRHGTHRGVGI